MVNLQSGSRGSGLIQGGLQRQHRHLDRQIAPVIACGFLHLQLMVLGRPNSLRGSGVSETETVADAVAVAAGSAGALEC